MVINLSFVILEHGRQGYVLFMVVFMGVLFWPALMVVWFFMSAIILTALDNLIGQGFQVFSSGLRTGTFGFRGLITLFSVTFPRRDDSDDLPSVVRVDYLRGFPITTLSGLGIVLTPWAKSKPEAKSGRPLGALSPALRIP